MIALNCHKQAILPKCHATPLVWRLLDKIIYYHVITAKSVELTTSTMSKRLILLANAFDNVFYPTDLAVYVVFMRNNI